MTYIRGFTVIELILKITYLKVYLNLLESNVLAPVWGVCDFHGIFWMLAAQEVASISKLSFFYLLLQGPRQWDFKSLNFVDATVEKNGPWIVTCVFFYEHGLILIPAYIVITCLVKCGMKLLIHS